MIKGVILAAGYGTRFLPATKTVPKEMIPLLNRPSIDYIVEDFIKAGIQHILIITSRRKKSLEDYFDREIELEHVFSKEGKTEALSMIRPPSVQVYFARQQEMKGPGHALLQAKEFVGDQPFLVAYPDDMAFGTPSLSECLIKTYQETGATILGAVDCPHQDVSMYGVLDLMEPMHRSVVQAKGIVEKPTKGTEPSHLISIGWYLYSPELMPLLEKHWEAYQHQRSHGEFTQIEALNVLGRQGKLFAYNFKGLRIDIGNMKGYLQAITQLAIQHPEYGEFYRSYLADLVHSNFTTP